MAAAAASALGFALLENLAYASRGPELMGLRSTTVLAHVYESAFIGFCVGIVRVPAVALLASMPFTMRPMVRALVRPPTPV